MTNLTPSDPGLATPRRIGLLGFDDVAALDLTGVSDAFYIASRLQGGDVPAYSLLVAGLSDAPFVAESGLRMLPDVALSDCPGLDTIVVPGGAGLRRPEVLTQVGSLLRERSDTRRLVSVCTGAYGLAASGLLDGRRATTHWRHVAHAARKFPAVTFEPDAIFIRDGRCYTSAGMTAGIDLALALIEEDHGPALSMAVARQMVVYMKRSGGQLQYSEPLRAQARSGDRFADLTAKLLGDLGADWSVESMAAFAGLSPRQFGRRFKAAFATTPGSHPEALRLDEARLRLAAGGDGLARIAHAVGFRSDDAFRRAFERRFGLTPSAYRHRFTLSGGAPATGPDHAPPPRA